MLRIILALNFVFLSCVLSMTSATAGDVALVIGNRNYTQADRVRDAEDALEAADALEDIGYSVVSGRDLTAQKTAEAMTPFLTDAGREGRIVILLSGHFVHAGNDTWFLPVDAPRTDIASINFIGLSLNTLMEIAATRPGQAAVFLGTADGDVPVGSGLTKGFGTFEVPQGVFVATGNPAEIALTLRRDFLEPGTGLITALAGSPESIMAYGFISDATSLVPGEGQTPSADEETLKEEGFWLAVQQMDTLAAVRLYLETYPNGIYADEANQLLNPQPQKTPEEIAQETEAALGLSRTERIRIQQNLTLLGYSTRGIDGVFGRGSRAAIAAWQQDEGFVATGYLVRSQILRLSRQGDARRADQAEDERRQQQEQEAKDRAYWRTSGALGGDEGGIRLYLQFYPKGLFADIARLRLNIILENKRKQANREDRNAWADAEHLDTIRSYRAYLANYAGGLFASDARQRIREIQANNNASNSERTAWETAAAVNSIRSYRAYLAQYPNGKYVSEAWQRITDIQNGNDAVKAERKAWDKASQTNTIKSYRAYLQAYPNGRYANEARQRISDLLNSNDAAKKERQAWNAAEQANTIKSYRAYLNVYPNGRHANEARQRISDLQNSNDAAKKERQAWAAAEQANTIKSYRAYLQAHPNGRHANEARQRISDLQNSNDAAKKERKAWEKAESKNTIKAYENYLQAYPNGKHAGEARQRIKALKNVAPEDPVSKAKREEVEQNLNNRKRQQVEQRLKKLGYSPGAIDGVFDATTRNAIQQFQRDSNFPVTGFLSIRTKNNIAAAIEALSR